MIQSLAFIIGIFIGGAVGVTVQYVRGPLYEEPVPEPRILATSTTPRLSEIDEEIPSPAPLPAIIIEEDTSNALCLEDCPLITP